jgi:O-antigen/teichoic acid export membrane protein
MNFYAVMALVQMAALLAVAYVALPYSRFAPGTSAYRLIVKLLWLQVATAPFYGLSAVLSSVLQAARRYDFMPRLELGVVTLRFAILWAGVNAGVDFFLIVVTQTAAQIALVIAPALWVMVRELGHAPHFRGARREDYRALLNISFYMFLVQLSVVLADRVDTTILGYAADDPARANKIYMAVSKPFLQIRQTGWTLAYMVMPAVASLVAARDEKALERIAYDGTRLHVGLLLPVALLAFVYAPPFVTLWVGDTLGSDAPTAAPLMRLFLVATVPLVLSVPVQATFGMGKVKAVALAALGGSLVNLPLSYVLTRRLGVAGVIWGTVLTTLFSNLLIPGVAVARALNLRPSVFARRTLSAPLAGAAALLATAALFARALPLHPSPHGGMALARWAPLVVQLTVCCLAYLGGYLAVPAGRGDLDGLRSKLRARLGRPA